jgi:hypothetical protein
MFQWLKTLLKSKPTCTCVLNDLVGVHNVHRSRESNCPTHGDAAMINSGHCPDCNGTEFLFGPEGGVAQMVMCQNCGTEFTVEVTNPDSDPVQVIYWGRVIA